MTAQLTRRRLLATGAAAALIGLPGGAFGAPPKVSKRPRLRPTEAARAAVPDAQGLIDRARLNADVCFAVADTSTGKELESLHPVRGLPPASVAKVLTALYALDVLGTAHRFETRLLATGPVESGVLKGDLILAGGGDPTLDTDGLGEMAERLKAAGVQRVSGRFLVWGGALPFARVIDAEQPDHVGYNPSVSGLNLNFNRVHFEWKRASGSYDVTMQARSARHRADVRVARMALVDRAAPVYTYSDGGGLDSWTVARSALGKGGSRWLPVRRPEIYAGEAFAAIARSYGLTLPRPAPIPALPTGARRIVTRQSEDLRTLVRAMLKYSTNITAEALGLAASTARLGRKPGSIAASARAMNLWAAERYGARGMALVDHSGLGVGSRMGTRDLVKILVAARPSSPIKALMKPITVKDEQGRPVPDHPIKVAAKTGTLNFVSGLAGYCHARDGTEMAFAIFAADLDTRRALKPAERERPKGGRSWNSRARRLQQDLIKRWGTLYAA